MIYVGIDVAKDKHDCFITNSDGEVLFKPFTISNNREGFENLFQRIESVSDDFTKVKVGLEATGHYSYNLLGFLLDKGLSTSYYKVVVFIVPLQGLYAILLEILWIVFHLLPLDGSRKATTTVSLYIC